MSKPKLYDLEVTIKFDLKEAIDAVTLAQEYGNDPDNYVKNCLLEGVDESTYEIVEIIPHLSGQDNYAEATPASPTLTPDQKSAFQDLVNFAGGTELLFRLVGYAGTGKSFLICKFIQWLKANKISYAAACPTNKAAKNLKNIAASNGIFLDVITVAQLLGQQPKLNEKTGEEEFVSERQNLIGGYELVIIDEFSMVKEKDYEEIVREASNYETAILFVGDRAQIPPINEVEPMAATSSMPEATLTQVVRYDGDIARVAEQLRSNQLPNYSFNTTPDRTITVLDEPKWLQAAQDLFNSDSFVDDPDFVRFLAWRNRTVRSLNKYIRTQLWGGDAPDYVIGDRLIALKPLFRQNPGGKGQNKWRIIVNNSEEATVIDHPSKSSHTFNRIEYQYWQVPVRTESGFELTLAILDQASRKTHKQTVEKYVKKKQWSSYFDLSRRFDEIGYGYALTVHKAQGSSINNVFIDVTDINGSDDSQKLLYTALTRARERAFIFQA